LKDQVRAMTSTIRRAVLIALTDALKDRYRQNQRNRRMAGLGFTCEESNLRQRERELHSHPPRTLVDIDLDL